MNEKKEKPKALVLNGISKSYWQGNLEIPVLQNLQLEAKAESLITLMGPSGSGKSTLLNILSAIESADKGSLVVFGKEIIGASQDELTKYRRETIGIVFQFFHLLPYLSNLENVALPLYLNRIPKKKALELAKEALDLVGLSHRSQFSPKELSGGEKQRVSIARAIVHKPKLVFADEPTGNLDSKSSDSIMQLFFDCVEKLKLTVFLVTHNIEIGKSGHTNLRMLDGRLINSP